MACQILVFLHRQEATVGRAASRQGIAEALREVVRRVASGEPVSSVDVALGEGGGNRAPQMLPLPLPQQHLVSDSVTSIK